MHFTILKKAKAKAFYDAGHRSVTDISRGVGVSERTAFQYIAAFQGGELMKGRFIQREKIPRKLQLM